MRSTLIFLHILLSFLAFGGLLRVAIMVLPIHKKPRRDLHGILTSFLSSAKQMSLVAVVVVILGIILAYHAQVFGQKWVELSVVLYLIMIGTDHMAVRPSLKLAAGKLDADMARPDNHDIAPQLTKIKLGYGAMAAFTIAILWLMVFKPA